ncbi:hypothetical protein Pcinc_036009 [Petrolisthes cinctipes]|uniref:Uncharacterized protein n=1 Tax=Petrolisthes cinctipes TaxID=88211 RepID=A0AAE1EME9_PETCI|nr:hypothetical protein Pcinc_036009 [Petrolisthes cinctipes]
MVSEGSKSNMVSEGSRPNMAAIYFSAEPSRRGVSRQPSISGGAGWPPALDGVNRLWPISLHKSDARI